MVKMKLKIDLDANKLKYTSVIRQSNGASIQEISKNIEENKTVIECDYFDTNKLIEFQKNSKSFISYRRFRTFISRG